MGAEHSQKRAWSSREISKNLHLLLGAQPFRNARTLCQPRKVFMTPETVRPECRAGFSRLRPKSPQKRAFDMARQVLLGPLLRDVCRGLRRSSLLIGFDSIWVTGATRFAPSVTPFTETPRGSFLTLVPSLEPRLLRIASSLRQTLLLLPLRAFSLQLRLGKRKRK